MDLSKLTIALLSIAYSGSAISNGFTRINVDEPGKAQYMRTSTYTQLQAKLATVGSTEPSLQTSAPNTNGGKYLSATTTNAATPQISTNVKIPVAGAAGATVAATLAATVTKANLAKAAVALMRVTPALSAISTFAWLANAGYQYLSATDEFKTLGTGTPTGSILGSCSDILGQLSVNKTMTECTTNGTNNSYNITNITKTSNCSYSATFVHKINGSSTNRSSWWINNSPCTDDPNATGTVITSPQVKTPDEVQTGLSTAPTTGSADTTTSLNNVINEAIKNNYVPETTNPTLRGPNGETSLTTNGPTTTTTKPDGSVITNNTTYNTTFNGDTAQLSQTETTITTPASGSPTTETVQKPVEISNVDVNNQLPTTTQTSSTTPSQTDCDKYPNTIGCSQYGTVEPADVITPIDVSIELNPTSLGDGVCPAPKVLNLVGQPDLTMSYQPYCDFATGIKPIVVAFAWLSAGFIVFGAVREG